MQRDIGRLDGHSIICGMGRVGRSVARELVGKPPFVMTESGDQAVFRRHVVMGRGIESHPRVPLAGENHDAAILANARTLDRRPRQHGPAGDVDFANLHIPAKRGRRCVPKAAPMGEASQLRQLEQTATSQS